MKKKENIIFIAAGIVSVIMLMLLYFTIAWMAKMQHSENSIWTLFLAYISGSGNDCGIQTEGIYFLRLLARILESLFLAILASLLFARLINQDVKLVFPQKIVIRRRTSEGSSGKLTLGVLIGNPSKATLYDVECSITCCYVKKVIDGDTIERNREVVLVSKTKRIENYHRFSFDLDNLHKKFWRDFLDRPDVCVDEDSILVTVSGRANTLGGMFISEKKYQLSDIGIDLHNPETKFWVTNTGLLSHKQKKYIDWTEFPRFFESGETERKQVIQEIERYVASEHGNSGESIEISQITN